MSAPDDSPVISANNEHFSPTSDKSEGLEIKMPPNEADEVVTLTVENNEDSTKVKFVGGVLESHSKGGNSLNNYKKKDINTEFQALTKDELMPYATDKFWVTLRWTLFISFWIIWVGMLVISVAIVIKAPKCPPPKPKQWWQKAPIYQVYPKSFKDTDGDGKGDLKGITSKLDYLTDLGIGSICLASIYKSPQMDNGYDIQDFEKIDEAYGTLEDFKELLSEMHSRGLKLIMDFEPNHSSDQHEWFQKSINGDPEFLDFYVWRGKDANNPPNNWKSVFGGSAWKWNEKRRSWYLHQFSEHQPDFNLNNPKVIERLKDAMKYWLELGVDGFRFVSVANMIEAHDFANEIINSNNNQGLDSYKSLIHIKTFNLDKNLEILSHFRNVLNEYSMRDGDDVRIMMTEAYVDDDFKYYGVNGTISHLPLNFRLISKTERHGLTANLIATVIKDYIHQVPTDQWPNFVTGNHDNPRVASRFGPQWIDAMNMIMMLLPGSPVTYYGEELGMKNSKVSTTQDKIGREPYRSPMQWNDEEFCGFSQVEPWVPLNDDCRTNNVMRQSRMDVQNSHMKIYKSLAELRKSESILYGSFNIGVKENVLVYTRVRKGNPGFAVIVNFGDKKIKEFDVTSIEEIGLKAKEGTIITRAFRAQNSILENDSTGNKMRVNMEAIPLDPYEGIVLSYVPKN